MKYPPSYPRALLFLALGFVLLASVLLEFTLVDSASFGGGSGRAAVKFRDDEEDLSPGSPDTKKDYMPGIGTFTIPVPRRRPPRSVRNRVTPPPIYDDYYDPFNSRVGDYPTDIDWGERRSGGVREEGASPNHPQLKPQELELGPPAANTLRAVCVNKTGQADAKVEIPASSGNEGRKELCFQLMCLATINNKPNSRLKVSTPDGTICGPLRRCKNGDCVPCTQTGNQ